MSRDERRIIYVLGSDSCGLVSVNFVMLSMMRDPYHIHHVSLILRAVGILNTHRKGHHTKHPATNIEMCQYLHRPSLATHK